MSYLILWLGVTVLLGLALLHVAVPSNVLLAHTTELDIAAVVGLLLFVLGVLDAQQGI